MFQKTLNTKLIIKKKKD